MSTITKDGKVYQNTALYIDNMGKLGFIKALHEDGQFRMIMNDLEWTAKSIRPNDYESGTITPAPIAPENGNWYRVEVEAGVVMSFYFTRNRLCITEEGKSAHAFLPGSEKILSKLTVETK